MKTEKTEHQHVDMSTSTSVINKLIKEGYTECFRATAKGLHAPSKNRYYSPEEVTIINFYRFEGESDPADNSILYIIETSDLKGTLIDAYGAEGNSLVSDFMSRVENTGKKNRVK